MRRNISQQINNMRSLGQQGLSNVARNVHIFRRQAEDGDKIGLYKYGWALLHGEGVAKNERKGAELIKQSYEKGLVEGALLYASLLMQGRGLTMNKEKGIEIFREFALEGNPVAQYYFGFALENGDGIQKNIEQAFYWYQKSAEQRFPLALAQLHEFQKNKKDFLNLEQCHISQLFKNENDYSVIGLIAEGGFSYVYKIRNIRTGEFFALKVFKAKYSSELDITREAKILVGLNHPCILNLHGILISHSDKKLKIMTKYFKNGCLADALIENWRGKNHTTISKIIIGIAAGMRYVHKRGLIHRDLKPGNILINDQFNAVISDFGLGCFEKVHHTFAGTPEYLAPEILNNCPYGNKVDVYSFGLILYEIIYGSRNFIESFKNIDAIKRGWRPKLNRCNDAKFVHNAIFDIISDCWDNNPNKRPTFIHIFQVLEAIDFKIYSDVDVNELRNYADEIDPDEKIQLDFSNFGK